MTKKYVTVLLKKLKISNYEMVPNRDYRKYNVIALG